MKKKLLSSLSALLILSGCSAISQKEVFDSMNQMTVNRGVGELVWLKTPQEVDEAGLRVNILLKEPLSEANAVRITLINSPYAQKPKFIL